MKLGTFIVLIFTELNEVFRCLGNFITVYLNDHVAMGCYDLHLCLDLFWFDRLVVLFSNFVISELPLFIHRVQINLGTREAAWYFSISHRSVSPRPLLLSLFYIDFWLNPEWIPFWLINKVTEKLTFLCLLFFLNFRFLRLNGFQNLFSRVCLINEFILFWLLCDLFLGDYRKFE